MKYFRNSCLDQPFSFDLWSRIKLILHTPVIIWVFIILSLFVWTVTSRCARRRDEGFHHKRSFQDPSGRARHPDERESWGFLCLALISLTDAGSANQIQLSATWAFSLSEETCWRRRWSFCYFFTTSLKQPAVRGWGHGSRSPTSLQMFLVSSSHRFYKGSEVSSDFTMWEDD